ncbi:MAG: hypothetical protein FWC71_09310 [Defluviitaleaceae bacterium]|nr:hypothetical protein [Defluviitaleaceae bacterium]
MEKMRNIMTLVVFMAVIFGLCIAFIAAPETLRSQAERRLLARAPELSAATVLDGAYMYTLDEYMQDQFPLREAFRRVNAVTRLALGRRDNNGYFLAEGHLSSLEFPLNAEAVHRNAMHLDAMARQLFAGLNVFYAVIPDKNYFLAEQNGFPVLDYSEMMRIVHHRMQGHTYIDLFGVLSLDDFYRTDIHWRQENLLPVAAQLAQYMGIELPPHDGHTAHTLFSFRGSFHGPAALPIRPDELVFLTNPYTEHAIVRALVEEHGRIDFSRYITINGERLPLQVYMPELFGGMDSYDVFLAGAQAIVTIEVPDATTDRELIILRDSFGSSIAPLLLGGYAKITLVDIRYVATHHLPMFIEITNQDILFMYSTIILNQPGLFR